MNKKNISYEIAVHSILFLLCLLILSRIFIESVWPCVHEGVRYLCLFDQFRECFMGGIIYPRWLPDYYGGHGNPLFLFYQPGFFYWTLLVSFFVPDTFMACAISVLLLFFAGAAGVFRLAKVYCSSLGAFFVSVLFMLTPYLYVNLYVRGDLSELASTCILPWILFACLKMKGSLELKGTAGNYPYLLALLLAALVYAHPFTSLFFYPVAAIMVLYLYFRDKCPVNFVICFFLAVFAAVILSSPYWLTAFMLKDFVHYRNALDGQYQVWENTIGFSRLLSRSWGFGYCNPVVDGSMSLQLGLPHFLMALAGFYVARKNSLIQISFILYVVLILAMTGISIPFWKFLTILHVVQFPWRLLSVIIVLQALCISGIFIGLDKRKRSATILFIVLAAMVIIWNSDQFKFKEIPVDIRNLLKSQEKFRTEKFDVYEATKEFVPLTVKKISLYARGEHPLIEVSHRNCVIEEADESTKFHFEYRISAQKPLAVAINQIYFPGWKIFVDGTELSSDEIESKLFPDGRMAVEIQPGKAVYVSGYYDGPPYWKIRNLVIVFLFIIVFFCIRKYSVITKKEDEKECVSLISDQST